MPIKGLVRCENTGRFVSLSAKERFELYYVKNENGCWDWQSSITKHGYGRFIWNGRQTSAHRYSYETFVGQLIDGLIIHHKCNNRRCVNPSHLQQVTQKTNVKLGKRAYVSHTCKYDHALVAKNVYWVKGKKQCKACSDRRSLNSHKRKRLRLSI